MVFYLGRAEKPSATLLEENVHQWGSNTFSHASHYLKKPQAFGLAILGLDTEAVTFLQRKAGQAHVLGIAVADGMAVRELAR